MMVFKRRQVVVLSLVLMIVIAGYLQYSYKRSSTSVSGKDTGKLGEAVYVDNNGDSQESEETAQSKMQSDGTSNAISASKQTNDYFAQTKLERETAVGKDRESLQTIAQDANADKDVKAKAYDQMMALVDKSQKEMRIESLVKEKGYSDVIALFGEDGSLDIIVKAPNLTSSQVAQITDAASRQANVEINKIHIKNIY